MYRSDSGKFCSIVVTCDFQNITLKFKWNFSAEANLWGRWEISLSKWGEIWKNYIFAILLSESEKKIKKAINFSKFSSRNAGGLDPPLYLQENLEISYCIFLIGKLISKGDFYFAQNWIYLFLDWNPCFSFWNLEIWHFIIISESSMCD